MGPRSERVYTRAYALCDEVGTPLQRFRVLCFLRNMYSGRGQYQTARTLGEEILTLAERLQEPALLLRAHYTLGVPLYSLGEFSAARSHLEQVLTLHETLPPARLCLARVENLRCGRARPYPVVSWLSGSGRAAESPSL